MNAKDFFIGHAEMKEGIVEGNVKRRVYTGTNMQVVEYNFPPDKTFPVHSHPEHEQMGYLVSGKMGFLIGGVVQDLLPGQWYRAPIGVEHNAWTYDEPSVLLDIFAPPRNDLR